MKKEVGVSDFIREVDEDYRRDKALEFWKSYGWILLLAAGLIILAVSGYSYYENAKQKQLEAQATSFLRAEQFIAKDRKSEGLALFEEMLSQPLSPGYTALINMRLAQLKLADGDNTVAAEMYEALAKNPEAPQNFRDLAQLTSTSLMVDNLTSDDVIARLSGLTLGSDFRFSASELIGVSLLREGKKAEALPYFRQLQQANDAPATLRARAQTLLNALDDGDSALPDVSGAVIEAETGAEVEAQ